MMNKVALFLCLLLFSGFAGAQSNGDREYWVRTMIKW